MKESVRPLPKRRNRIEPPKVIYSYRSLNDRLRDSLMKREIWLSNPLQFNDPYDCALPIADSCSPELAQYTTEHLLRTHPMDEEFKRQAREEALKGKIIRTPELKQEWRELMAGSGVACFAEDPDNVLMWSHYADKHHGVCLGFELAKHHFHLRKVVYQSELPNVSWGHVLAEDNSEAKETLLTTKSHHWEYEHEWRLVELSDPVFQDGNDPRRALRFDESALKRVIFGLRIKPERREELEMFFERWPTQIHYYQAEHHHSRFKVALRPYHPSRRLERD